MGITRGGTLAPNKSETNCGGVVLWVGMNWTAQAETLAEFGNIMNILFATGCPEKNEPQFLISLVTNMLEG